MIIEKKQWVLFKAERQQTFYDKKYYEQSLFSLNICKTRVDGNADILIHPGP